jgi:predicted alpha/beta hydrolase family esterase
MKNAIILHGTGTRNNEFWFPYAKERLEKRGYEVWLPQLPNAETPNLKDWLPFVLDNGKFNEETILIGHSAGSQLILSILENLNIQIKQALLVSGYAKTLRANTDEPKNEAEPIWDKIKGKAKQFVFINSDNDPWGCNDKQGRIMLDHLGGILVIPKGEGHMGSTTYNQPYKEHPLVIKLLDINY